MECGLFPCSQGLDRGAEHRFREHGERHEASGGIERAVRMCHRYLQACKSGFGKEDLSCGKPLDDVHGPLTARTWPGSRLTGQRCIRCRRRLIEQAAAEGDHLSACTVGHPSEVADAGEAPGQDVLQEAAQELLR